tara:strand:- start:1540 stop:1929 length:390 start_codon:yes stop_codon:yes gene_type:complete
MATHAGSEGVVFSGSNQINEVRSYTISETGETLEDTSMGDTSRSYLASLKTFTGSLDVYWDETDAGQGDIIVGATIVFNLYPEGNATGDTYYTGNAIVTEKSVTASFDGLVEMSVSVQGTGALTEGTVA